MRIFEDILDDVELKHRDASREVVDVYDDSKLMTTYEIKERTKDDYLCFGFFIETEKFNINAFRLLEGFNETLIRTDAVLAYCFTYVRFFNIFEDGDSIDNYELPYYLKDCEIKTATSANSPNSHNISLKFMIQWDWNATKRKAMRFLGRLSKLSYYNKGITHPIFYIRNDDDSKNLLDMHLGWIEYVAKDSNYLCTNRMGLRE